MTEKMMPRHIQYTIMGAAVAVGLVAAITLSGYAYTFYTYYSAAREQAANQAAYERCAEGRLTAARPELEAARLFSCLERESK